MMFKMANNCFGLVPFVPNKVTKKNRTDEYIVSRELKETFTKQEDGGIVRDYEVIETSAVSREDYINSFQDEVGLENILRKVSLTGDVSLLNKTGRVGDVDFVDKDGVAHEKVCDITDLPQTPEAAAAIVARGYELFKDIPEDLKANRSFAQFVEGCSDEELKTYLQAQITKQGDDK